MSQFVWVDDPFWKGGKPTPKVLRSYAMRSLHAAGMSVGDVARRYEVDYHTAYKAIQPERRQVKSSARVLREDAVRTMKRKELLRTATKRHASPNDPKVLAAVAELDRRNPQWMDDWLPYMDDPNWH